MRIRDGRVALAFGFAVWYLGKDRDGREVICETSPSYCRQVDEDGRTVEEVYVRKDGPPELN